MARGARRLPKHSDPLRAARQRLHHARLRAQRAAYDLRALTRRSGRGRVHPYEVFLVPPDWVSHLMAARLPARFEGRALGGDWDRQVLPLSDTALARGLRQRFLGGLDWIDTELHPSRYHRRCENEPPQYERYSEERFLRRGRYLDRLYERLAAEGYADHRGRREPAGTEMSVAVTREGVYARHSGGMHRLIMAQIIGLPHVPVRFFLFHVDCGDDPVRTHDRAVR